MRTAIYVLITLISLSCYSPDCNNLPNNFESYDQAINLVKGSKFKISESANIPTSGSSWVKGAHYYSCHGQIGYLIIEIDRKTYIHANVPVALWQQFKNASSFCSILWIQHKRKIPARFKWTLKYIINKSRQKKVSLSIWNYNL